MRTLKHTQSQHPPGPGCCSGKAFPRWPRRQAGRRRRRPPPQTRAETAAGSGRRGGWQEDGWCDRATAALLHGAAACAGQRGWQASARPPTRRRCCPAGSGRRLVRQRPASTRLLLEGLAIVHSKAVVQARGEASKVLVEGEAQQGWRLRRRRHAGSLPLRRRSPPPPLTAATGSCSLSLPGLARDQSSSEPLRRGLNRASRAVQPGRGARQARAQGRPLAVLPGVPGNLNSASDCRSV